MTPAKLTSGTGTSWAWQDWTPTLTNLSGGTTTFANYVQVGKSVYFKFRYVLAGAGVSGAVTISLPVTAHATKHTTSTTDVIGFGQMLDNATVAYDAVVILDSTTSMVVRPRKADATYLTMSASTSSAVPMTWAANDVIYIQGFYEAA